MQSTQSRTSVVMQGFLVPGDYCEVQVKKENPDLAFGEVGKRLGELWKEVTASEKAKFEEMAKKDKVGNVTAVAPCTSEFETHPSSLSYATTYPVQMVCLALHSNLL